MATAGEPTAGQLAAFLAAERTHESGRYTTNSNPGGASGAYQFEPTTWSSNATEAGYGQYAGGAAYQAPAAVQDAVAAYHATQMYKAYGGTWQKVAEGWYYPADVGKVGVVPIPGTNGTVTITSYGSGVVTTMNQILANGGAPPIGTSTTGSDTYGGGPTPGPVQNGGGSGGATGTGGTQTSAAAQKASAANTTGATAAASIDTVLNTAGLGTLIPWANALSTTLAAKGLSPTSISTVITTQLKTQQAFKTRFPGFDTRVANGFPAMSISEYLTYEATAKAMGKAAGLPTGFLTNTEIGKLVANDVSIAEFSTRLTNAYQVAANAPQETKDLLTSYFGIKTGTLAAYFLTPAKATKVIKNQITAAQIGTAGVASGFTLPKPGATTTLGKVGTTGNPTTTAGKIAATPLYLAQVGVTGATAADTFQSLSKLIPLTEKLPGTGTEKTSLTQNDLVNYGFFGTNTAELNNVQQARTAPFRGGGGFVENSSGVVGAGYGNSQGGASGS